MVPFSDCPTRNFHVIMLPQLILGFRQRQAIIMLLNRTDNILFSVAHSFKTIRLHELPLAIVTQVTLFYSYFPVPFTIFNNIL